MAAIKTTQTNASVDAFLATVPDGKRQDCQALIELMRAATKCEPKMWGSSIVGFDTFHYTYANGKPGEICMMGFSPRKQNLVLYVSIPEASRDLLPKLGKFKTSKACLYVNHLSELHLPTLKQLLRQSVNASRARQKGPL